MRQNPAGRSRAAGAVLGPVLRLSTDPHRIQRIYPPRLIHRADPQAPGDLADDTVPTGFRSLDRLLGGGLRQRDLVVLGGDVGSGKSALALSIAIRGASLGTPVVPFSGEVAEDRLL